MTAAKSCACPKGKHAVTCSNHTYRRELKPCHWCGGVAEAKLLSDVAEAKLLGVLDARSTKQWLVRCTVCSCKMPLVATNYIHTVRAAWSNFVSGLHRNEGKVD